MEAKKELPKYQVPQVITYSDMDILEQLGPAQANTGYGTGDIPDTYTPPN